LFLILFKNNHEQPDIQGKFAESIIFLNSAIFEWFLKGDEMTKEKAKSFGIMNIAHEIIHVLAAWHFKVKVGKLSTPDKEKFKVKTK
jgi:hypothetical protein